MTLILPISLVLMCSVLAGCSAVKPAQPAAAAKTTYSCFDQPTGTEERYGVGEINVKGVRLNEFLILYQDISGRTIISSPTLPASSITLRNQTPVTRTELLQLLDTALSEIGIAMILSGENAVKAVPIAMAAQEAGPIIDLPADRLPDSGSYMVRMVRIKKGKPSEFLPLIQPFAKVPNGIIPMDKEQLLVLRDFSSNIRQMLRVIDEVQKSR